MDSENKYNDALERAKKLLKTSAAYDRFTIEKIFPELKESEDERIRKELIFYLGDMPEDTELRNGVTNRDVLVWLEKQKEIDKEIVFRPLAGTDIIAAARQALEKIEIGKEVVLAFNGVYIPVNCKTVAEICNEYFAWTEKQGEKKSKETIKSAQETIDDWHERQDTNVKEATVYNIFDNNRTIEYVYILDYSTGRVMVVKHSIKESIEDLFKKLGLKESQCNYMVSSDVLSIEYINF